MNAPNDVGALLDASALDARRVSVIVLCGMVVLMDGFDLQTMALAVPSLTQEWHTEPAYFSFALSAALIGMLVGSAVLAPVGDRVGRRPLLITGMLTLGAASLLTALATTPGHLSIWRFLTGLGLGMSLPNATALTSEYVPLRSRVLLISVMYCSVSLGAVIAGFLAPVLIDAYGWRSIFVTGGAIPIVVACVLALVIPESLRLLVDQRLSDPRIEIIAKRFLPRVDPARLVTRAGEHIAKQSVLALLVPRYRARTILLWATFALNSFILFVLVSWLPTVLSDAGWSRAQALRGSVMNQAGGIVGGLVISWLIDRGRVIPALIGGYIIVAVGLALFLVVPGTVPSWVLLLLLIGAGVSGGQAALNALSVLFYPPSLRATSSGWATTLGRIGALTAPLAGGIVLREFNLLPVQQLALLIFPVLLCGLSAVLLCFAARTDPVVEDHSMV